jgi:hypothetical protein
MLKDCEHSAVCTYKFTLWLQIHLDGFSNTLWVCMFSSTHINVIFRYENHQTSVTDLHAHTSFSITDVLKMPWNIRRRIKRKYREFIKYSMYNNLWHMHSVSFHHFQTDQHIYLLKGSAIYVTWIWAFPRKHTNLSLETRKILYLYWSYAEVDSRCFLLY